MRPNRPHIAFTLEDCMVLGGHFYSALTLVQSLQAGMREHMHGRSLTNTEHLASEMILHRLVWSYHRLIQLAMVDSSISCLFSFIAYGPSLMFLTVWIWDTSNLAALVIMCLSPELFEPQNCKDSDGVTLPWNWPPGLPEDRRYGKRSGLWLLSRCLYLVPEVHTLLKEVSDMMIKPTPSA
jgi:hypothetical protein